MLTEIRRRLSAVLDDLAVTAAYGRARWACLRRGHRLITAVDGALCSHCWTFRRS